MTWPAEPRVLIIDDNPGDALLAERALLDSRLACSVEHCSTLDEAETRLRSGEIDAILLDLCLTTTEGGETIRRTRSFAESTPIVVLTGSGEDRALAEALEADADDFLPKEHVGPDTLERALRHARQRRRLTVALQRNRRQVEQSEARLRAVLSTVSDGIVVVDRAGRVLFHNEATPKVLGRPAEELVGRVVTGLAEPDTSMLVLPDLTDEGAPPREVEVTSVAIRWEGEDAQVVSLHDITERRRLEARIQAVQRIEAVGQLAGGMAHEMNNVLAVILANAGLLTDEPDPEERHHLVRDIEEASRRGSLVVRRLLAYARRRRLRLATVDLGAVVSNRTASVARALPDGMSIEVRTSDSPSLVRVDPDAVEQILLNLLRNAHESVDPDRGRIEVEVESRVLSEGDHQGGPVVPEGEYVCFSVKDNGAGMDAETLDRAFEPFFSTKGADTGSGLGLATVYGLTKQQGGFVFIDSEPGRGTSVSVYFPVVQGEADRETRGPAPIGELSGSETILLAEDEDEVRRTTARVLRRFGYQVLEAADGREALAMLRSRDDERVDLIVSDVVMPNLGGRGLHEALQDVPDAPPILFVSGYTAEDLRRGALLEPSLPVLHKPWAPSELLEAVRATLSGVLPATPSA